MPTAGGRLRTYRRWRELTDPLRRWASLKFWRRGADDKAMQLQVTSPQRRLQVPVLLAVAFVMLVTIGFGFLLRSTATRLEVDEDLALLLRSELHEADAALLSALLTGRLMEERKDDLGQSLTLLADLAGEAVDRGIAPPRLIDDVATFARGAEDTLEGIDAGASIDELIRIHDEVIAVGFLATSAVVDAAVSEISQEAARNRRLADVSAWAELVIVGVAVAGTVSWMRRLRDAEESMVEKDQFIAAVSHELRTPLTGIVGMAELVAELPGVDDEVSELVGVIVNQSKEMSYLVEDLLVAARATMSDLSIVSQQMKPCAEIRQALGAVTAPEVIELTCLDEGADIVESDPLRFRQIVRNLATNAVRYGGGDIRVDVARDANWFVVAVSDAGSPLSVSQATEIFEPYTRGEGPTVTGSVGLGLPVSRMLAQRLGGDLRYHHRGGRNVFELRLPAVGIVTPQVVAARPAVPSH